MIYIPLWFYSNINTPAAKITTKIFTFHYGSILINQPSFPCVPCLIFTFHYGSILISEALRSSASYSVIYIPLWFYSNSFPFDLDLVQDKFTFHYGSILIWFTEVKNTMKMIYIPLWFYSNFFRCYFFGGGSLIYIPLWFYSNFDTIIYISNSTLFTFHYGSILIVSLLI